jgi:hypothetical protein
MDAGIRAERGETAAHRQLKRLSVLWAQAQGYSACALEVSLPRCRYRADVAAFRPMRGELGWTAIFECKQAIPDLRRDNRCADQTRERLQILQRRKEILEKHLRVHYPEQRRGELLFPEFDGHDFQAIGHRSYGRVLRQFSALQNQLRDGTKFETLRRYRCANLLFLVLPNELFRPAELPCGWGALVVEDETLNLVHRPQWHETSAEERAQFLQRLAVTGTRRLNRRLGITFEELTEAKRRAPL